MPLHTIPDEKPTGADMAKLIRRQNFQYPEFRSNLILLVGSLAAATLTGIITVTLTASAIAYGQYVNIAFAGMFLIFTLWFALYAIRSANNLYRLYKSAICRADEADRQAQLLRDRLWRGARERLGDGDFVVSQPFIVDQSPATRGRG